MSTKHVRTIADLVRFGAGLKVECRGCGTARTLDGYQAARAGGGAGSIADLATRLKCGRCGKKAAKVTILPPV
jgi:hypothetical protein